MSLITSERANPLKDGDAKPRVYHHRNVTTIARLPKMNHSKIFASLVLKPGSFF
jgi:hypothetical protein